MTDREKVFDAIRNCITEPKCRDCPWDECEKFDCKKVSVPVSLMLDALKLLKEQEAVVRCKDCEYCEYPKAEKEWCKKGHLYRNAETWFCADGKRR